MQADGRLTLGEFAQLNGVANAGAGCSLMAYRVERQQDKSYHVLMVYGLHLAVNRENHFIIIQTIITHTTIPILDS